MPLSVRTPYEELQHQLEELHEQDLFYVGEYIFAGFHPDRNNVDANAFHLWDIRHGDSLDRIIMLFADASARKAATLVIENRHISVTSAEIGRFHADSFLALGASVPMLRAEDVDHKDITFPIRLIYRKPLFLTLLYHCNLLLDGHNLFSLFGDGAEHNSAQMRKTKLMMDSIHKELQDYYQLDAWDANAEFREHNPILDSLTRQLCEMSKCLTGLQVIRQDRDYMAQERNRQRIDDLIRMAKDHLRILGRYAGMEFPCVSPERTIALWHVDETFPEGLRFGEMIALRVKLEHTLETIKIQSRKELPPKQRELLNHRDGILYQQIVQLEKLLAAEQEEYELEWEDYLV